MARLSGSEVLNFILVLINCWEVAVIFLELAAVVELTELLATEDKTTRRVSMMVMVAKTAALLLDLVENS
jgi:hypothetical protein